MNIHQTGDTVIDSTLQEIITRFKATFPKQICSFYVEGSYADQSAVTTSDLDLRIVFHNSLATEQTQALAKRLIEELAAQSPIELDIDITDEVTLRTNADPMFKLGAKLIYGEEIRTRIPLMPIGEWARRRMHAAYWLLINVFGRPQPVRMPLAFPNPDIPFYGYANRTMQLADGQEMQTMRNLIRVTGWIATARIAYEAQSYVVRKRECVCTYRRVINDEWTALLTQIDQRCRTDWHYRIPANPTEQEELRAILAQTLRFENHFLAVYRQFVLVQLAETDRQAQEEARKFLENTPFADAAVIRALQRSAKTVGGS